VDNLVNLSGYDIIVWFVGDESTINETYSTPEQAKVVDYLEQGGYLFTCGSEIGWDLFSQGTTTDKAFYNNYLKAAFIDDGTSSGRTPATGIAATLFSGVSLNFGQVYTEDYPDGIGANGGSVNIMQYANGTNCGIGYKGLFGSSSNVGAVVYLGFPVESVSDKASIRLFMQKLLAYFDGAPTNIQKITLNEDLKVFPTIFSDEVIISANNEKINDLVLHLVDFSGKIHIIDKYRKYVNQHEIKINLSDLQSAAYILEIVSPAFNKSFTLFKK
jgi:hypothetical protein